MVSNSVYNNVFLYSKKNSVVRKKNFDLTREEFEKIVKRSGGKCEVTGIEFNEKKVNGSKRRPFIPSLDRIDSAKGYSFKNCRLVCVACNLASNEWGDSVLRDITRALYENKGKPIIFENENIKPKEIKDDVNLSWGYWPNYPKPPIELIADKKENLITATEFIKEKIREGFEIPTSKAHLISRIAGEISRKMKLNRRVKEVYRYTRKDGTQIFDYQNCYPRKTLEISWFNYEYYHEKKVNSWAKQDEGWKRG